MWVRVLVDVAAVVVVDVVFDVAVAVIVVVVDVAVAVIVVVGDAVVIGAAVVVAVAVIDAAAVVVIDAAVVLVVYVVVLPPKPGESFAKEAHLDWLSHECKSNIATRTENKKTPL